MPHLGRVLFIFCDFPSPNLTIFTFFFMIWLIFIYLFFPSAIWHDTCSIVLHLKIIVYLFWIVLFSFSTGDNTPLSPFCMTNIGEWDAFRNIDMDKEVCFSLCMLKEQPFIVYSQITVHMSFNYDCQRAGQGSILTLPSHILAGHRLGQSPWQACTI